MDSAEFVPPVITSVIISTASSIVVGIGLVASVIDICVVGGPGAAVDIIVAIGSVESASMLSGVIGSVVLGKSVVALVVSIEGVVVAFVLMPESDILKP